MQSGFVIELDGLEKEIPRHVISFKNLVEKAIRLMQLRDGNGNSLQDQGSISNEFLNALRSISGGKHKAWGMYKETFKNILISNVNKSFEEN